jgi:hypothetical protein
MLHGDDQKAPLTPPRTLWSRLTNERLWQVIGGITGVLGLLLAVLLFVLDSRSTTAQSPAVSTVPQSSGTPQASVAPGISESGALAPPSPVMSSGSESSDPDPLYLTEVPKRQFIREPAYSPQRSSAAIGGQEFSPSYWFVFNNCGGCTYATELNIKPVYRRLVGVVGLTDDSRHDNVIDGIVHFSIYANDRLVFGPKRIEYPGKADFDVDVTGTSRIRLVVGDGTNYEYACWCGAKFTK